MLNFITPTNWCEGKVAFKFEKKEDFSGENKKWNTRYINCSNVFLSSRLMYRKTVVHSKLKNSILIQYQKFNKLTVLLDKKIILKIIVKAIKMLNYAVHNCTSTFVAIFVIHLIDMKICIASRFPLFLSLSSVHLNSRNISSFLFSLFSIHIDYKKTGRFVWRVHENENEKKFVCCCCRCFFYKKNDISTFDFHLAQFSRSVCKW